MIRIFIRLVQQVPTLLILLVSDQYPKPEHTKPILRDKEHGKGSNRKEAYWNYALRLICIIHCWLLRQGNKEGIGTRKLQVQQVETPTRYGISKVFDGNSNHKESSREPSTH